MVPLSYLFELWILGDQRNNGMSAPLGHCSRSMDFQRHVSYKDDHLAHYTPFEFVNAEYSFSYARVNITC